MRQSVLLAFLGVVMVILAVLAGWAYDTYEETGFAVVMLVTGLVAYLAFRVARDAPEGTALLIIFVVACLVRLIAISDEPLLSSDIYRYVWDGRVQGAGINPFRYFPAEPALAFLRDTAIYPEINRADYAHTAYPPMAQIFFFLVTRLGDKLDVMRLAFIGCEVVIAGMLLAVLQRLKLPRTLIVGYAWHPLAIWETANGGHVDALLSTFAVAALLLLIARKRVLGSLLIACGVLVKPYAIAMLPAFWRPWDWRAPLLCIAVVVLLYLPYLSVGSGVIGFVPTYLNEEGFVAGGGFWLVALIRTVAGDIPGLLQAYLVISFGGLAYAVIRILRKPMFYAPQEQIRDAVVLLFIGLFILSPNYPWYYLPLVPFVVLEGGGMLWATTILATLLHVWWPTPDDQPTRFLIWKSVINGGWMLALAWSYVSARRRRIGAIPVASADYLPNSPS